VVVFLNQLGAAQAERMAKVGVKGKVVTLKVWRAVENAPDKFMKVSTCGASCDVIVVALVLIVNRVIVFTFIVVVPRINKSLDNLFYSLKPAELLTPFAFCFWCVRAISYVDVVVACIWLRAL
jgi:hypothetical protein